MTLELGELREAMSRGCMQYVEDFVSKMKHEKTPFYAVYCARPNYLVPNQIRQTVKAYREKPPSLIGVLVWYVDNAKGLFEFKPELSAPWDVPSHPLLLSDRPEDQFISVMERGKELNVLVS
jgi:hypothetical protein